MMGKREEAARALYDGSQTKSMLEGKFWEELSDPTRDQFFQMVDAVIACIREPDEKMREVAKTVPIAFFNCDVTNKEELLKCLQNQDWNIDTIPGYQAILDAIGD